MTLDAPTVLQSPLAKQLFAGNYKDVLRATIDAPEARHAPSDTPFIVGALVFSGRQDEALALHRWWMNEHGDEPTVRVASQFFLSVGECRSGRYASAIACCRDAARAADPSHPLHGFFVHQAIGLLRHFHGRIGAALRHALMARQLAVVARFPYGRMLALDLLGHALTLSGQVHSGMAVLEQSAELAESLGLVENAGAPRTAIVAYRARYAVAGADSRRELPDVVAGLRSEDAYARRMLLSELAMQHALYGEKTQAVARLEEAAQIALPDGDRRAKIRKLLADAVVSGLGYGATAAGEKLGSARALLDPVLDDALAVEILWARALSLGLDAFDADADAKALAEVLAKRTAIGRAKFLAMPPEARKSSELASDDRMASLLDVVQRDRDEARHRVTIQGLWGLLPMVHALPPGRRIYLLHDLSLMVVEEQGSVVPLEMPGAVLVALLTAIAAGPVTKEELVRNVWHMNVYRPDRHDALVHTATSRLRNALGACGSWVRSSDSGYTLAEGITIHDERPRAVETVREENVPAPRQNAFDDRRAAVLAVLAEVESLSTTELAQELKISEMTALRMVRQMAQEGTLERTGQGKRTRYRKRS